MSKVPINLDNFLRRTVFGVLDHSYPAGIVAAGGRCQRVAALGLTLQQVHHRVLGSADKGPPLDQLVVALVVALGCHHRCPYVGLLGTLLLAVAARVVIAVVVVVFDTSAVFFSDSERKQIFLLGRTCLVHDLTL
uniref:(northern house mosquito) hypothetical protein n=1 Tax=Culex pipiens TaxID=7175 RepID=A0A8D8IIC1_CULPI